MKFKKYYKILSLLVYCFVIALVIENKARGDCTFLMTAIINKQTPSSIGSIIAQGADVNACDVEFLRHVKPVLRYTLDGGTDKESVEIIRMLISAGADVNAVTYNRVADKNVYGMMPLLTYATIYSSAEIVQIFIDAGAKDTFLGEESSTKNSPIVFKKTALMIAQELGKTDIVKILGRK